MERLPDPVQDLLRAYRRSIDPLPAHVERQRQQVVKRILDAPTPAIGQHHRAVRWWAIAAIAAGLVLVAGVSYELGATRLKPDAAPSQAVWQSEPPAALRPENATEWSRTIDAPGPQPTQTRHVAPDPLPTSDPSVASDLPQPASVTPDSPAPTIRPGRREDDAPSPDALVQESALLSRARAAQASADWGRVLVLVDEHRRKYPRAILLEERLVLEAVAACNLGDTFRGKKVAAVLKRRFPASFVRARIDDLCRETTDE